MRINSTVKHTHTIHLSEDEQFTTPGVGGSAPLLIRRVTVEECREGTGRVHLQIMGHGPYFGADGTPATEDRGAFVKDLLPTDVAYAVQTLLKFTTL